MSTFVKNYYSPKNPAVFLAISWETGYRDLQVRYNDRLVHTVPNPGVLVDGIKIQDEELGKIKLKFTTARPRKLEVKVNNRKFKTVNKLDLGYDYSGLIAIFSVLSLFAIIEAFFTGWIYKFNFAITHFSIAFFLGLLIALIYALTSYFLSRKKTWLYFIGTGIFTITTLISIAGISFSLNDLGNYTLLVVRLAILVYLYVQIKHILREMRKSRGTQSDDELLDG